MFVDEPIILTEFIKPICLWQESFDLNPTEGVVAGWGLSEHFENTHKNIPKQLKIPIVDQEECFLKNYQFARIGSKRTFCGGARDGSGPCSGNKL